MAEVDGAESVRREPAEGENGIPVPLMALAEGEDACFAGHASKGFFAAGEWKVAAVKGRGAGVSGNWVTERGDLVGSGGWDRRDIYCCGRVEWPDEVDRGGGGEDVDDICGVVGAAVGGG